MSLLDDEEDLVNDPKFAKIVLEHMYDEVIPEDCGIFTIKKDNKYGFAASDGSIITEPKYSICGDKFYDGMRVVGGFDMGFGFVDSTGIEVIPVNPQWCGVGDLREGIGRVYVDNKWGFIDKNGEIIIPCQFDDADWFVSGKAFVIRNGDLIEIDHRGNRIYSSWETVTPFYFDEIGEFVFGLAPARIGKVWHYINTKGEIAFPDKFDEAKPFKENGLAWIRIDKKWGVINIKGETTIPCQFDYCGDFNKDGVFSVKVNSLYRRITSTGKLLPVSVDQTSFCFNLHTVKIKRKWGYLNTDGDIIIPCQFDEASEFTTNGLARIMQDGKYGVINTTGEIVIPCQFDEASKFTTNGLARIMQDGKYGVINTTGEIVIPCQFDWAEPVDEENDLATVKVNDKWGCINSDGEFIIPCKFDSHIYFSDGIAEVSLNEKYGLINPEGQFIIQCQFDKVLWESSTYSKVALNGKWGLINRTTGEIVIPCEHKMRHISEELVNNHYSFYIWKDNCWEKAFFNGVEVAEHKFDENRLTTAQQKDKLGLMNTDNKFVTPCIYDWISRFCNKFYCVKINGKYGIINRDGQQVVPCSFDQIAVYDQKEDQPILIKMDNQYGYINLSGEIVIPRIFEDAKQFTENGIARVKVFDKWGVIKLANK